MHLLATKPGAITDGTAAVDLGQSPGEIVFLSAADSELACLAAARARLGDGCPAVRLANLTRLGHNLSVDLHVERVVARARLVIVRLLGGAAYWPYGIEQIAAACREGGIALACLPGDDRPDDALMRSSTLPAEATARLWRYCIEGGIDNAASLLGYASGLIGRALPWAEPAPLPRAGFYRPGHGLADLKTIRPAWPSGAPVAAIVFYRALLQAGNTEPVDALAAALARRGLAALPMFVQSLKEPAAAALIDELVAAAPPAVVLALTGFSAARPGAAVEEIPFAPAGCPVIQAVLAAGSEEDWREGTRGLATRDVAMHVALPEIDGRIHGRAIAFKAEARIDPATECPIVVHRPVADRVAFTADLAAAWARLGRTAAAERRVALVLANYPNRDGRIGNGVGLDTPASTVAVLRALGEAGYAVADVPEDGAALMRRLAAGPTNDRRRARARGGVRYPLAAYEAAFGRLPAALQAAVVERWGAAADDPFVEGEAFRLPALLLGRVVVAIQPARGYNLDPKATYHDPALVPPHGYLAFHAWLREAFGAHAVVHMGKHGNLEWLPGKALALSAECWPEAALGPLPNLYPFIVNDPGEGAQAKRRTSAVVVDHLTPPLARAGLHGPLAALERLVDEYAEAASLDPRRLKPLARRILEEVAALGLDRDLGIRTDAPLEDALAMLDAHLCDLKELQIRDGLHVFGSTPEGERLSALLVAIARLPRRRGEGADAGLTQALAGDLGLGDFDPLAADLGAPWTGPRPPALVGTSPHSPGLTRGPPLTCDAGEGADPAAQAGEAGEGGAPVPWRTAGDTVERLEALAQALVAGGTVALPEWCRARAVLGWIETTLRPAVVGSGAAEMAALLAGLDGRFVAPGPSGAPTRGRPDVLPTGRNFYSVDCRAVPTPAAWQLGWRSAALIVERYRQERGDWPRQVALSAWGTANMRTGGDDIAQALALMGARPTWDDVSGRVTGYEILPLSVLDRPRVDVTLRVSGFFRDAFPAQIDLVDSAARAIAALDEPEDGNPLAARVAVDAARLEAQGLAPDLARRRAGHRVFGSKPGAYGAGLQALIDEKLWRAAGDLAEAFLAWGGHAYGDGAEGRDARDLLEARLGAVQLVLHNQDNREHDLLDSDDYYQFEGGLAAAVTHLSGTAPAVYHNDHARPERPIVRTLGEEIARVVRGRATNPKWIAGVMRHGYKGAFEMAATVDYLFAFAATTGAVHDHHFEMLHDAYLGDPAVLAFLREANPAALAEMADRFAEALDRGLWRARSNSVRSRLAELAAGRESAS